MKEDGIVTRGWAFRIPRILKQASNECGPVPVAT